MLPRSRQVLRLALGAPFVLLLAACPTSDEGRAARGGHARSGRMLAVPAAACGSVTYEGCCHGQMLYYCSGGSLVGVDCSTNLQCGWDWFWGFYACGTTGGADPGGTHPKSCSGFFKDAGPPMLDSGPPCGNKTCESFEDCSTCPADCGACDGCKAKETPKCSGCKCEACVCNLDSYCCTNEWDSTCVAECKSPCGGCGAGDAGPKADLKLWDQKTSGDRTLETSALSEPSPRADSSPALDGRGEGGTALDGPSSDQGVGPSDARLDTVSWPTRDDDGCACRAPLRAPPLDHLGWSLVLGVLALAAATRRRRG